MIVDRVRQIIEKEGISDREFYRRTGLSNGLLTKSKQLGADKLEKILIAFPNIDAGWLLTGEKTHQNLKTANNRVHDRDESYNTPALSDQHGVPYFDVDFLGGFDLVFEDDSATPAYFIDFPPFNDSDCWVNVTGKSMSPFISHGDLVALKQMKSWKDFLLFGEIYAVITEEYRAIKIVAAGQDSDHFTLMPYNKSEEFSKQPIPKKLITHMFQVKGSIKKFF